MERSKGALPEAAQAVVWGVADGGLEDVLDNSANLQIMWRLA